MALEIEGILFKKYPVEVKGTFEFRDFVLELKSGNYSEYPKFQLVKDRCALLDNFEEGDSVKVSFDLRGREWQGKYLTNLNAWRLEKATGATTPTPPANHTGGSKPKASNADDETPLPTEEKGGGENVDDLPF